MLGQYQKCNFCKKRFKLLSERGIIKINYNYITLIDKYSGGCNYVHKRCWILFKKTNPPERISRITAGFDFKRGIFLEGGLEEKQN